MELLINEKKVRNIDRQSQLVQNKATLSGGLANQGKVIYMVRYSIQSRIFRNIHYYPVVQQSINLYPDTLHL